MSKVPAPLSLDLDNKWSYLKTHGDESWQAFPSYLETIVPRALAVLEERGLLITWFIVGKDAAMPEHRDVLFCSESSGCLWLVDDLARSRGVPSRELRGPARSDR